MLNLEQLLLLLLDCLLHLKLLVLVFLLKLVVERLQVIYVSVLLDNPDLFLSYISGVVKLLLKHGLIKIALVQGRSKV